MNGIHSDRDVANIVQGKATVKARLSLKYQSSFISFVVAAQPESGRFRSGDFELLSKRMSLQAVDNAASNSKIDIRYKLNASAQAGFQHAP